MSDDNEVYLVDYRRSPFSRARPNDPDKDVFNTVRMDEVLGNLIKSSLEETGIRPGDIDDVIVGCALQTGENWLYGGRHPVFLAGLPFNVPSMAMDRACASSLNAISIGAMEIMTGSSDVVIAGGMEHMTHVPLSNNDALKPNLKLLLRPEFRKYDMNTSYNMGLTAEKLASLKGISREDMDMYSVESHRRAAAALDSNYLSGEIKPVEVERNGDLIEIKDDQSIRRETSMEGLSRLPPAFRKDGVITAGNSSPLNAGAAMDVLMSGKKLREYGLTPMARITGFSWAGVDPSIMGEGPVPASKKLLSRKGMDASDVDLWEINEAFAVVALNAMRELGLDHSRVNIHGGGISIGHPLGATGARITGTLAREMKQMGKKTGIATLCVGGGQGYSIMLERD